MSLDSLNTKLERSQLYIFCNRHKRVINIIQGIIVIGLLIGIDMYVVKDYKIKQQIADHCGYETSQYKCICDKQLVEDWEQMEKNNFTLNLGDNNNGLFG